MNRNKNEPEDQRIDIDAEMDFFPVTYELPDQWHMFVEEFKKKNGVVNVNQKVKVPQNDPILLCSV